MKLSDIKFTGDILNRLSARVSNALSALLREGSERMMTTVDTFTMQVKEQEIVKSDPEFGLDPDFEWVSVNALILIGLIKCMGRDSEKANVFYRVVQPEMTNRILIQDKDIKMAIFFLTALATILELMQRELAEYQGSTKNVNE